MSAVIINADDFGLNRNVNRAIKKAFQKKYISSATLMANMEGFEEAILIYRAHNLKNKVGIHFNLTEGAPLTDTIKQDDLFCKDGLFCYRRNSCFYLNKKRRELIQNECIAQIRRIVDAGIKPTHLDSHHHVHTELLIFLSISKILKSHGIRKVRIPLNFAVKNGLIKRIYKSLFLLLLQLMGFNTTQKFGHHREDATFDHKESIEFMCHPILFENDVVDSYSGNIFTPRENISSYDQL